MSGLNLIFQFLILLLSLFILGKSAHYMVSVVTRIGHHLHLSQFVTGFIILGVATSTPEIFIGIQSAVSGTPQLSLGNLFGANIILLTLISGLAAVLNCGINVKAEMAHNHRLVQISLLILSPLILLVDSRLSRLDALFLVVMYVGYLIYTYKQQPADSPVLKKPLLSHKTWPIAFLGIIGLLGLVVSARAVVITGVNLATLLHIPPLIVGTLLLSLGTNLPELSVVFAAIRHHHPNLVVGDVLGSASTNTLVIALLGLISPFVISEWAILESAGIMMVVVLAVFFYFAKTKDKLSFREGLILIGLYIAFLTSQVASLYLR